MANPTGDSGDRPLRLDFDRQVKIEFRGMSVKASHFAERLEQPIQRSASLPHA